jgi:hypothetical protein
VREKQKPLRKRKKNLGFVLACFRFRFGGAAVRSGQARCWFLQRRGRGGVRCRCGPAGNYPVSLVMISWPPACAAAAASTPAL